MQVIINTKIRTFKISCYYYTQFTHLIYKKKQETETKQEEEEDINLAQTVMTVKITLTRITLSQGPPRDAQ